MRLLASQAFQLIGEDVCRFMRCVIFNVQPFFMTTSKQQGNWREKNAQQQRNKKHIRKLGQFFMNEFDYLVRLMHAFCVIIFRCFRPLQMWWRAVDDKCVRYLKCSGCMLSHALVIFRHRPFYLVAVVFDKNIPHGFKWSFRVESHLYGDTVNTFFFKEGLLSLSL